MTSETDCAFQERSCSATTLAFCLSLSGTIYPILRRWLGMPVERPFFPKIEIANQQDRDINHHFIEAVTPEGAKNHRPRVQKDGFHVKKYENHGHEIEFYGKRLACVAGRLHAAFVSLLLGAIRTAPADDNGKGADQSSQNSRDQ